MSNSSNTVIRKDAGDEWLIAIMNEPGPENNSSQHNRPTIPMLSTYRHSPYGWYLVGIGPYSKEHPRELDELKKTMVRQFVKDSSGVSIEVLYNKVAEVVMAINARKYYDEAQLPSDLSEEEFVNILFLDGCFVLHYIFSELRKPENLEMLSPVNAFWIKRDLLLLQSQLPFQVLQSLMRFRFEEGEGEKLINDFINNVRALPPQQVSFMEPIMKYFGNYTWLPQAQSKLGRQETGDDQPAHLLELCHRKLISKKYATIEPRGRSRIWYTNHSAKDLRKRGIHFRPSRTDVVTDVKFMSTILGGILKLPRITIDNFSKGLLYNLIKYERHYDASKEHLVSSYITFLDSLIQDAEDVNILQAAGILVNNLGSDEQVVDLFHRMMEFTLGNPYAYSDVKWQIELHCRQITRRWIAEWLQAYFSSPWAFIAFVAATLALTLTAIQTHLAAFPPKK